jgi:WD40 repeat protein
MRLNTIAGRSFHDLGQYPVFPWILKDYESQKLDLRNPQTFRDLKWPIGAQTQLQRDFCHQRYKDGNEMYELNPTDEFPPFHHGSHYSCMGFIFWYMIRMEPFTSLGVWLQDGKFDHSDRLFYSIPAAYRGTTTNHSDVKELIPEFFYYPEFLENLNDIDLGVMQSGKKIGVVELPPWCSDAYDFIRQHRDALESEYVSQNLHNWIDLIFGYKQRPPTRMFKGNEAAIESCNVFFHLTYMDAVNLTEVKATDDALYQRTIRQIDNYGQTPSQLFTKSHPKRLALSQTKIIFPIASCVLGIDTVIKDEEIPKTPTAIISFQEEQVSHSPVIFIGLLPKQNRLVTVDTSRIIGFHSFTMKEPDVVPPFTFKVDASAFKLSTGLRVGNKQEKSASLLSIMNISTINIMHRDYYIGAPFSMSGLTTHCSSYFYNLDRFDPRLIGTPDNKKKLEQIELEKTAGRIREHALSKGSKKISPPELRNTSHTPVDSSANTTVEYSLRISPAKSVKADDMSMTGLSSITEMTAANSTMLNSPKNSASNRKKSEKMFRKSTLEYPQGKDYDLSSHLFAFIPDYRLLFSCGHWDYSFKVTLADTGKLIQSTTAHSEVVTCLTITEDYGKYWLVTGSRDCTVMVWEVYPEKSSNPVVSQPLHVLYGHDDTVTAVASNAELDLVVSGSDDGTIIIHSLRQGSFIHSIILGLSSSDILPSPALSGLSTPLSIAATPVSDHKGRNSNSSSSQSIVPYYAGAQTVKLLSISKASYLIVYSSDGRSNRLYTYSINGRLLHTTDSEERLFCMCLSEDGRVVLTGGERCLVVFRWTHNLQLASDGPRAGQCAVLDGAQKIPELNVGYFLSPIRSLYLTPKEAHLVVGLDSGLVRVLAQVCRFSNYLCSCMLTALVCFLSPPSLSLNRTPNTYASA